MIATILTGKKPLISVGRSTVVRDIAALLYENRIGAVVVVDNGAIVGLVSERDICAGLHTHGAAILDAVAEEVMTSPVITVAPQQSIVGALGVMTNRRIRHLPVVEGGRILGLVSIGDLVKRRIEAAEAEAEAMKEYITTS